MTLPHRRSGRADPWSERLARGRVGLAQRLNRLLLGPVSGALPGSAVTTLEEALTYPRIEDHVVSFDRVRGAGLERYPFPASYPPSFRRERAYGAVHDYLLRDVLVGPRSGVTWLPDGTVLQESVGSLRRLLQWGQALHEPLMPADAHPDTGPVVTSPIMPFGDWMFDVLPGLVRAATAPTPPVVLLHPAAQRYALEALDLLGLHAVPVARPRRVRQRLLTSIDNAAGFIDRASIDLLRERFVDSPGRARAIYISRRRARKRPVIGEARLEDELRERGVLPVVSEGLHFAEQIEIFSGAELVVGPHGSGLANLVWTTRPCHVLEILPPRSQYFNDAMARLTLQLGSTYDYVHCDVDSAGNVVVPVTEAIRRLDGGADINGDARPTVPL